MESVEALVLALAAGYRVVEVPVQMTSRAAGQPSNRSLRLLYHYLRLLLVIVVSAGRRPPEPATATHPPDDTGSPGRP
jgi:hypothetical protein